MIPLNPPAGVALVQGAGWSGSFGLKYWHLASLDAPSVAIAWAYAFAWTAHLHLTLAAATPLGLMVWALYIADRLLDVRAGQRQPGRVRLEERHWFHWRHSRALGALAVVGAAAAAWMVEGHLPVRAVRRDSLMGVAALAYFSGVHGRGLRADWIARLWAKAGRLGGWGRIGLREVLVAVIFSAGCVLPVLPMGPASLPRTYAALAAPAVAFAALAWLNLRAIEVWESSRGGVARIAYSVAAVFLAGAVALIWVQPRTALLLLAAMASALLLAGLDEMRGRMDRVTLRAAADAVLLTPLLLTPLLWLFSARLGGR